MVERHYNATAATANMPVGLQELDAILAANMRPLARDAKKLEQLVAAAVDRIVQAIERQGAQSAQSARRHHGAKLHDSGSSVTPAIGPRSRVDSSLFFRRHPQAPHRKAGPNFLHPFHPSLQMKV